MSGGLRVNAFILDMFWHWLSHLESISICVALEVIAPVDYFWGGCAVVFGNAKMFVLGSHFESSPLPGTKFNIVNILYYFCLMRKEILLLL